MANKLLTWKQRRAEITDELRALNESAAEEQRDFDETEQAKWDDLTEESQRLAKQIERYEALGNMPNAEPNKPETEKRETPKAPTYIERPTKDTQESIYLRYVRTGDPIAANEIRAYNDTDMNITTAADGEVAVPVGMVRDIVARRDEMSLVPKLGVRMVPGKGTTVNYPIDNEADVIFAAVAEGGSVLQDAPALTEKAFTLAKYGKHITLSWELLRDEDAMLMSFLNNWIARGWAGTLNSLLITEALASGTAGLTLDAAAAIGIAEVPELVGKLQPEYQDGAQWIMHPSTWAYINGLNSANSFTFAPTPGSNTQGGVNPNLWGFPANLSSYATAYAASAKSLIFGNFYFMGMRQGTSLTTLRDPYSAATTGQVKLWFWFDAVFGVLQAEAIQYATHPSA